VTGTEPGKEETEENRCEQAAGKGMGESVLLEPNQSSVFLSFMIGFLEISFPSEKQTTVFSRDTTCKVESTIMSTQLPCQEPIPAA